MFRLALVVLVFIVSVDASQICKRKYLKSFNQGAIAVSSHKAVVYSPYKRPKNAISHDPFLGLYLVKTTAKNRAFFKPKSSFEKGVKSIGKTFSNLGYIKEHQLGLSSLAIFSQKTAKNGVVASKCCELVGVGVGAKRFIQSEYIEHFIRHGAQYGDAGFRLKSDKKESTIESINPFFKNNPFKVGDKITSMDKKKVTAPHELMQRVLFAKPNSEHSFVVKRGGKKIELRVSLKNRAGGGLKSDSYLEPFGLFLSKKLTAVAVRGSSYMDKLGVKRGDRLLEVNGYSVDSEKSIRAALNKHSRIESGNHNFLLEREGFQFFVHFDSVALQ